MILHGLMLPINEFKTGGFLINCRTDLFIYWLSWLDK